MSNPLTLQEAQELVLAYNHSTLRAQREITEHYRTARKYYADSLRNVVTMVAPEDQTKLQHYVEKHLLSWPVAGE